MYSVAGPRFGPRLSGVRPADLSGLQGPREPEPGEHAVVEAGDGADLIVGERQYYQPVGVHECGVRVALVDTEGGLAVGPGGDEATALAIAAEAEGQEPVRQLVALVFQRYRGHDQPCVVGEQGDDGVYVPRLERVGEPGGEPLFGDGTRRRRRSLPR